MMPIRLHNVGHLGTERAQGPNGPNPSASRGIGPKPGIKLGEFNSVLPKGGDVLADPKARAWLMLPGRECGDLDHPVVGPSPIRALLFLPFVALARLQTGQNTGGQKSFLPTR